MGLSEVLQNMMRMEQLKELKRQQQTRALEGGPAAGEIFEAYLGGMIPTEESRTTSTGPSLAGALGAPETPTGFVNMPPSNFLAPGRAAQQPGQVPIEEERAFQGRYDVPLEKFAGRRTPSDIAALRHKKMAGTEKEKTREDRFSDDLYNIQNEYINLRSSIRQDPRAKNDPKKLEEFNQEASRTALEKLNAVKNQYPELIMKPRVKRSLDIFRANLGLSPLAPERKKK